MPSNLIYKCIKHTFHVMTYFDFIIRSTIRIFKDIPLKTLATLLGIVSVTYKIGYRVNITLI